MADIITLAEYKDYKKINSNQHDTELQLLITAASSYILSYCNRTFLTDTFTETFDGTEKEYYPKEFPITSVTSLKYSSNLDGVYDTALAEWDDFVLDTKNSRIVSNGDNFLTTSGNSINSMEIEYVGGLSAYPDALKLACVHLVEYYKESDYTPRKSLAGASKDNVIIPDKTARLPVHVRRVLEHYRGWEF